MTCDWHVSDQTEHAQKRRQRGGALFSCLFLNQSTVRPTPSSPVPSNAPSEFRIQ